VDEFLREELNYVVVESWVAAEEGVRLLKSGVDGRATFLIHPPSNPRFLRRAQTRSAGPA
jgi:chromosome segregation protein